MVGTVSGTQHINSGRLRQAGLTTKRLRFAVEGVPACEAIRIGDKQEGQRPATKSLNQSNSNAPQPPKAEPAS